MIVLIESAPHSAGCLNCLAQQSYVIEKIDIGDYNGPDVKIPQLLNSSGEASLAAQVGKHEIARPTGIRELRIYDSLVESTIPVAFAKNNS